MRLLVTVVVINRKLGWSWQACSVAQSTGMDVSVQILREFGVVG